MKKLIFKFNSRSWITITGFILAAGFLNCIIVGAFYPIHEMDWAEMLAALGILLGINVGRDIGLRKVPDECKKHEEENKITKYCVPLIGWIVAGGFLINCLIYPYLDVKSVSWGCLMGVMSTLLAISATRDVNSATKNYEKVKEEEQAKTE